MVEPAGQIRKWAVLIGINGCHESLGELRFCVNDARLTGVVKELRNGRI